MKFKELQGLKSEELTKKEQEVRMELIKQNAQIATGTTPKSPGMVRELKKTLARIQHVRAQQQEVTSKDA